MSDKKSLIILWIQKAERDLLSAKRELSFEDPVIESVCFHSQQAVEKSTKALIISYNIHPEQSHNIGRLILRLPEQETELKSMIFDLDSLTDFAVELRYPDIIEIPSVEEAKQTFELAERVLTLVKKKLDI